MRGAGIIAALALSAGMAVAAEDQVLILPSGLQATLHEMLWDQPGSGLVYRFRFVAPGFTVEGLDFDIAMIDLEYLCNDYALSHLANTGPKPKQLIISLADRKSEFGVADPAVAQVFEAYRVENGACIWEMF